MPKKIKPEMSAEDLENPLLNDQEKAAAEIVFSEDTKYDITCSYSRKLNLGSYGGPQFETVDILCSKTLTNVPATEEQKVTKHLHELCQLSVENRVEEIKTEIQSAQAIKGAAPTTRRSRAKAVENPATAIENAPAVESHQLGAAAAFANEPAPAKVEEPVQQIVAEDGLFGKMRMSVDSAFPVSHNYFDNLTSETKTSVTEIIELKDLLRKFLSANSLQELSNCGAEFKALVDGKVYNEAQVSFMRRIYNDLIFKFQKV